MGRCAPPAPQGCAPCAAFAARAPAVCHSEGRGLGARWAVHMSPQGDCGQCSSGKDCPRNPLPLHFFNRLFGKRSASGRRHGPCGQGGAAVGACGQAGRFAGLSTCAHVGPACPAGRSGMVVVHSRFLAVLAAPERERWQRHATHRVRREMPQTRMDARPPPALVHSQPCTSGSFALHFLLKKCLT